VLTTTTTTNSRTTIIDQSNHQLKIIPNSLTLSKYKGVPNSLTLLKWQTKSYNIEHKKGSVKRNRDEIKIKINH